MEIVPFTMTFDDGFMPDFDLIGELLTWRAVIALRLATFLYFVNRPTLRLGWGD